MNQSLKNIRLFDNFQEGTGYVASTEKKSKEFSGRIHSMEGFKQLLESEVENANQMLQGKEFPGLTKQEQENTVYYSLLDGQKRKWFISFRITPNNWIETKITSTDPQHFKTVESLFNSLDSFKDIGPSAGLDKDTDLISGVKQTSVNKDEIIKIFDTLVKNYPIAK